MNSSGRRRILKYQRKVSISPSNGKPICPGGSFVPVAAHRALRGATYQSSFHHQSSHPSTAKPPINKPNHTVAIVISIFLKCYISKWPVIYLYIYRYEIKLIVLEVDSWKIIRPTNSLLIDKAAQPHWKEQDCLGQAPSNQIELEGVVMSCFMSDIGVVSCRYVRHDQVVLYKIILNDKTWWEPF